MTRSEQAGQAPMEDSQHRWSYQALLPSDLRSASTARQFVSHRLAEHDLRHLIDDVRLVASELATNAALHARRPFSVGLRGDDRFVVLSVRDSSRPAPVGPSARAIARWGPALAVVEGVTHDWGVVPGAAAPKGVWASFAVAAERTAEAEFTSVASMALARGRAAGA